MMYGVGRFADIQAETSIPKSVLSDRLRKLVAQGLAAKEPYRDGSARTRHAYVLTKSGQALVPVILSLMHWGDRHLKGGDSALSLTDKRTGDPVRVALTRHDAAVPLKYLDYKPV